MSTDSVAPKRTYIVNRFETVQITISGIRATSEAEAVHKTESIDFVKVIDNPNIREFNGMGICGIEYEKTSNANFNVREFITLPNKGGFKPGEIIDMKFDDKGRLYTLPDNVNSEEQDALRFVTALANSDKTGHVEHDAIIESAISLKNRHQAPLPAPAPVAVAPVLAVLAPSLKSRSIRL